MNDMVRYPIGHFEPIRRLTDESRKHIIYQVPGIAKSLRETAQYIDDEQLHIPYRKGGWTISQIIHHLTDNDMNAYIRFKRALTEEEPLAALIVKMHGHHCMTMQTYLWRTRLCCWRYSISDFTRCCAG